MTYKKSRDGSEVRTGQIPTGKHYLRKRDKDKIARMRENPVRVVCLTSLKNISRVEKRLCKLGYYKYLPFADYETATKECREADVAFVNPNKMTYRLDRPLIEGSSLKYIVTASTGTNHIDLEAAKEKGIEVISLTREYEVINKISSTAEHALGLTLALIRQIPQSFNAVKNHEWDCEKYVGRQISNLTVGVIGYGRLGRRYAAYLRAMGATVYFYDPYYDAPPEEVSRPSLDEILATSDVISLHVHLTDETRQMVNVEFLGKTKKKPYLINTSRGDIVDESAVVAALKTGILAGYAADVLVDELSGNIANSPVIEAAKTENVIVTPHIGGMSKEARDIAYNAVVDILEKKYVPNNR